MNAEIIAVGSELLLGQIANTNAQFLSAQLAELGINVYFHTVVGDNADRLEKAVKVAQTRANLIIFTGGLGPTKDDLTKETIARLLQRELVIDKEALHSIEAYFARTGRTMTENNKKQALVLQGSTVFRNEHGMAPGMAMTVGAITYMLLPGPPKEMQPMFSKYGRPFLMEKLDRHERIESRVLRFFGIGESQLETEIEDLIEQQSNPTIAPLAGDGEVTLRLTAKHHSEIEAKKLLDQTEQAILARVGRYFYGYNDDTLFKNTVKLLKEKKKTVAAAESLTGGLFLTELTAIPGASQVVRGGVVCYTNEVKEKVLHVPASVLATDGAVSERCAKLLAENVRALCGADIGISFTGVAGPDPLEGKPVGTVYIGISTSENETDVHALALSGPRDAIRTRTAKYGCSIILKKLAAACL
ncbi:competence/damage-inducible protein A [Parageobacillus thermoglucosidasius]|uniref:Putative competence-damage inducible protein n=1 Tax=Geobacillus sp. (strain Y4.1MC1) TaxID=581103 RepID=A0A7U4DLH5_GEOS0|nr:competence/damage-inducible protein A [Parageobacillus thermoglucosidasius]REK55110.1 MAG: competence/damage-inducible protein A [Geobacillus sp.]MED4904162.1 competence/damage-inducible protein A [Parageobacillus thermoglucosidasius]MED4914729.1 competence/damage-inducible protein A [Parageobacillus thermoglucosidasius]MED4943553.1 competence/damage-inducible protein A [Parageobacillus thermoglucosidasius]MED4982716.1 competence/damage-inducible protein A [Parageobacillus thermoglucosidasi